MSLVPSRPHLAALAAVVLMMVGAAAWGRPPSALRTVTHLSSDGSDDVVLTLSQTAFRGRARLTPLAEQALDAASASLTDLRGRSVSIVAIGRMSVAGHRARVVRNYLVSKGVPPDSMRTAARPPEGAELPAVVIRLTDGASREW